MNHDGDILIVDDESGIREVCSRTLRQMGFQVRSAPDGPAALKQLNERRFDLVLTDMAMPESADGARLVSEIKLHWPATEAIVMTAYPSLETAIPTLKDGACDYLIKPFGQELLRSVIGRCFEKRRIARELDREKSLRRELQAAYQELQKVERLREAILSRLNHELRSPLFVGLMALENAKIVSGDQNQRRSLQSGLRRLQAAIEDLLLFAKLSSADKPAMECILRPRGLLEEIVENFRPLWEDKKIKLDIQWPETRPLWGDPEQIATAFKHLFLNAVNFNAAGGRILIRAADAGEHVAVSFSDSGIGIPKDKLPQIFDSFYQAAEYMTRKVGGLGLGLAIVRKIVEAHGGSIGVESEEGRGSVFTMRLPCR